MKPKILFTDSARPLIFEALNITVGDDGFLYRDGEIVLDMFDNKPVLEKDFAGIHKDGVIKGDLHSIMKLAEYEDR